MTATKTAVTIMKKKMMKTMNFLENDKRDIHSENVTLTMTSTTKKSLKNNRRGISSDDDSDSDGGGGGGGDEERAIAGE